MTFEEVLFYMATLLTIVVANSIDVASLYMVILGQPQSFVLTCFLSG